MCGVRSGTSFSVIERRECQESEKQTQQEPVLLAETTSSARRGTFGEDRLGKANDTPTHNSQIGQSCLGQLACPQKSSENRQLPYTRPAPLSARKSGQEGGTPSKAPRKTIARRTKEKPGSTEKDGAGSGLWCLLPGPLAPWTAGGQERLCFALGLF